MPHLIEYQFTCSTGREFTVHFGSQADKTYWIQAWVTGCDDWTEHPPTDAEDWEIQKDVEAALCDDSFKGLADDVYRVDRV